MTASGKKILVAEDDKFLMKVYQSKLKDEGYELITASDGEEALAKIKEETPNLVLLDIMMPKKNGFEVLKESKSNSKTKGIPIIILSNLGQDSDINEGVKIGADDYIIKSNISINGILEKIEKFIK